MAQKLIRPMGEVFSLQEIEEVHIERIVQKTLHFKMWCEWEVRKKLWLPYRFAFDFPLGVAAITILIILLPLWDICFILISFYPSTCPDETVQLRRCWNPRTKFQSYKTRHTWLPQTWLPIRQFFIYFFFFFYFVFISLCFKITNAA